MTAKERPEASSPWPDEHEVSRRRFLGTTTGALIAAGLAPGEADAQAESEPPVFRGRRFVAPVAVATWRHGQPAVEVAHRILAAGGSPLDATEKGINVTEEDPRVSTVGVGGFPNRDGVVELDAAIMEGERLGCGAVLGLQGIARPISVARKVLEETPHVQLVGEGARRFALAQGFETSELLTPAMRRRWEEWRRRQQEAERRTPSADETDHDTIGMVVLAKDGSMVAGCSTSGLSWKLPGRVGDSPIVGAGLYCDRRVGGASATGVGEEVVRICGSFLVVEAMRRGASAQEAVEEAVRRVVEYRPENREHQVAFIALSKDGDVGAASIRPGFPIAVHAGDGESLVVPAWSLVV